MQQEAEFTIPTLNQINAAKEVKGFAWHYTTENITKQEV